MPESDKQLRQRVSWAIARGENLVREGQASLEHLQLILKELNRRIDGPGVWISKTELQNLPMAGLAWERLLEDADRDPGVANIALQDSNHDVYTLAATLVAVRTEDPVRISEAVSRLESAVGTEGDTRWLAVGRNLAAYIISADLLRSIGVLPEHVNTWLAEWAVRLLPENNPPNEPVSLASEVFNSGSNAAAQEAFVYTALAAFLNDSSMLEFAWERFRIFTGDLEGEINLRLGIYGDWSTPPEENWVHDVNNPKAIIPLGVTRDGRRTDGAIINDMSRATGNYQWPPEWTAYPWVNLEGAIPCALILHRAGYPAFEVGDRAILRTVEYLMYLREETGDVRWFDGDRAAECVHIVNTIYGTDFPVNFPVGAGRTCGWTDFTHKFNDII